MKNNGTIHSRINTTKRQKLVLFYLVSPFKFYIKKHKGLRGGRGGGGVYSIGIKHLTEEKNTFLETQERCSKDKTTYSCLQDSPYLLDSQRTKGLEQV